MSEHYFLAPSGAGCTVNCPAAPMLQAKYPEDTEHPVTREGIAMHWAASMILTGALTPDVGTLAPNGVILDAEMLEGVDVYTSDVDAVRAAHPTMVLHVETKLHNDALHATANGGTPDAWGVAGAYIPVWDFKGGHGLVEVFENWQLVNYAALIAKHIGLTGLDDQQTLFDFRIIQPRAYHMDGPVRSWRATGAELRPYFNRLAGAYGKATLPNPPAVPGAHCKTAYCTAAGRGCDALSRAAWAAVDVAYESRAHDMSPADLGLALRTLERSKKMLDAQVEGMRGQASAMIARGDNVPGYAVKHGTGREVIRPEKTAEFIIVGEALGVNVAKPPQTITPKQAVAAGLPAEVVAEFSQQLSGERKLVAEDALQARRVFGK